MLSTIKTKFVQNRDAIIKGAIGIGATLLGIIVAGKFLAIPDDENDDFIEIDEEDIEISDVTED